MTKFLTTAGISHHVEEILSRAQHRVVIMSPYLRTRDRIRSLIKERAERGVEIHIVYGKEDLHSKERAWIDALPAVRLYFHRNLHAKCFMNESAAVVGSMNLYDFSELNNIEMGVLIEAQGDAEVFEEVVEGVERIIRYAQERQLSAAASDGATQAAEPPRTPEAPPLPPPLVTNDGRGHCIRCYERIPRDTNRPYCKSCYKAWADTGRGNTAERHCHLCGDKAKVSLKFPACKPCWRENKAAFNKPPRRSWARASA